MAKKKATINPKNNDNNCFQYALTVALNYQNIKKTPQRISNLKPFINQYDWKEIDFPAQSSKDWKKFESNNKSIALNVLYITYDTEKIRLACKSKHNFKRKIQVILLMITDGNGKKQHYLAVKSLSALLRGITLKHDGDFHYLDCFHSHSTEKKLKKHEKVCNDYDYCYVKIPNEDNKMLKYNHGEMSKKAPFIIHADLGCLLEKMHSRQNNPEKSYIGKKTMPTSSMFTHCLFHPTKNILDCYRGIDCIEKFRKDLREHATRIINYIKKEMIPLTDEENKFYKEQKVCYICKKEFSTDDDDNKKYHKVKDHCHYTGKFRGAAHSICNLRYKTPKQIPTVFHNGSTYVYHFIINQLAKKFEGKFECFGENTEK